MLCILQKQPGNPELFQCNCPMSDSVEINSSDEYHRQACRTGPGDTPQSPWRNGRGLTAHLWGTVENSSRREATPSVRRQVVGTYGCDSPKGFTAPPAAQPYDPPAPQRRQADPTPTLASCLNTRLQRKKKTNKQRVAPRKVILSFASELWDFQAFIHLSFIWQCDQLLQQEGERNPLHPRQRTEEFHIRARLLDFIVIDNQPRQMEEPRNYLDSLHLCPGFGQEAPKHQWYKAVSHVWPIRSVALVASGFTSYGEMSLAHTV